MKNKLFVLFLSLCLTGIFLAQDCKVKVEISTNHKGAFIYVDTLFAGKEKTSIEVNKGNHVIKIKDPNFKWDAYERIDTINVTDCSKTYKYEFIFRSDSVGKVYSIPVNIDLSAAKPGNSFFKSTTFKVLIGSAVILGGVAAYLKTKADKKYDDYLNTLNKSSLDESNRLDVYSGVALGLLQINFGYLIYKFLSD